MNPHLKQLWAAMRLPENFKKSYKFFCRGLDIRVWNEMRVRNAVKMNWITEEEFKEITDKDYA